MRRKRFYTAVLLGVMVLNISKYHIPHLEYNVFNRYIVENLCVEKEEENNECRGHCFLEKQINLVNETDQQSGSPTEKRQITPGIDDFIEANTLLQAPTPSIKVRLSVFREARIPKTISDIPVPPPKRFIS
jgi:hypothetical protein